MVIGLIKISKDELPQMHGFEKIMPFGRLFLAIPMGLLGTEHHTNTADIANIVPRWMPAHIFCELRAGDRAASRNDPRVFNHQHYRAVLGTRAMHYSLGNDKSLTRRKFDRAIFQVDQQLPL